MDSTNKPKLFPVEISKDLDKEDLTAWDPMFTKYGLT